MVQFWTGLIALITVVRELLSIGVTLFKFIRDEYDRSQRVALTKEIKAAVEESIATGDNSRLIKLFDPETEPFPRENPK